MGSGRRPCRDADRLYIKAWSYALLNKIAFVFALVFGLAVLICPLVASLTARYPYVKAVFETAIVQTTVTGIAALAYAVYAHYKRQQLAAENLMRYVLFSNDPAPRLYERVSRALSRVDAGFEFGGEQGARHHGDDGD